METTNQPEPKPAKEAFAVHFVIRGGGFVSKTACGRRAFQADGSQTRFATNQVNAVSCERCLASSFFKAMAK